MSIQAVTEKKTTNRQPNIPEQMDSKPHPRYGIEQRRKRKKNSQHLSISQFSVFRSNNPWDPFDLPLRKLRFIFTFPLSPRCAISPASFPSRFMMRVRVGNV